MSVHDGGVGTVLSNVSDKTQAAETPSRHLCYRLHAVSRRAFARGYCASPHMLASLLPIEAIGGANMLWRLSMKTKCDVSNQ